ncbi:hypothetical protein APUTEX25_001550, partial [Auxenochlorella protothecoides]
CPTTCLPTANCKCGTSGIPGGLDASVVPQFIVLTTDDAVTLKTKASLLQITDNHVNDNGCAMPATWFAPVDNTSVSLVQQLFVKGHEIATQTMSGTSVASLEEIVGAKTWYNQTAKLPMEKIQGFRAPYLAFSPEQRAILSNNGFRYDSSILESFPSTTSPSATNLLWPYTMDHGIPQVCTTGVCSSDEVYAGLWEFPVWDTQNSDASLAGTMNPQGDLYSLYKLALDNRRSGNRAPLGVYVTAAWLEAEPERLTQLNAFFDYAAALPYTWLVTISQVLDWINDPTVATKYAPTCLSPAQLLAELPGVKICTQPNVGCSYGTWDSDQCLCICQGAESTTGGYCRDAVGSCTVAKGYDFASNKYICPIGTLPPSPPPSPPTAVASPVSGPSWGPAESIAPVPAPTQVSPSIQLSDGLCGHDLLSFAGLTISGYESLNDGYAVAIKALDGSCETCAMAPVTGTISYISIDMGYSVTLSSVSIRSSYDVLTGGLPSPPPGKIPSPPPSPGSSPNPPSSSGGKSSVGAIAGGVIGGLVAAALLVWLIIVVRRRRQAAEGDGDIPADPKTPPRPTAASKAKETKQPRRRGPAINSIAKTLPAGATATLDPQSAEKPTMYTSPLRDFAKSMEAATLAQAKDVEAQVDPPSKE